MNDKTENLEKAFEYIRTFYNELAQMMADVIELMSKAGWEAPSGAITDGLSYSLDNPEQWMFYYTYKNFWNDNIDSHVIGMVIFFNEYMNDFPISVVCGKLTQPRAAFDKWGIYRLALDNSETLEDLTGEVFTLSTVHGGKTIEGDLFAISLAEIQSPEHVKDKIVRQLLKL